jgi:hypothetical protein
MLSLQSVHGREDWAWKAISDRLQTPCYLSRDGDRKIRSRKQRTDIGKYSFVNRTKQIWYLLPADALGTLSCKPSNFRKRVRKVMSRSEGVVEIIKTAVKGREVR